MKKNNEENKKILNIKANKNMYKIIAIGLIIILLVALYFTA